MTEPAVTAGILPASRVRLHDLQIGPDRGEWIVGRFPTRQFVALPEVGATVIGLLGEGFTIGQVTDRLATDTSVDFDVLSFVRDLVLLDFVAEIDGRPVPSGTPPPPSFPRLRPEHVRFALSPALPVLLGCLLLAAAGTMLARPGTIPRYRDLLWNPHGSVVLATAFLFCWSLVFLHELAHLVTARAAGVHARIRIGTRLQFLVLETDISGIELAPRRHRLTAYLAGIGVNLSAAATAVLLVAATGEDTVAHRFFKAAVLLALLPLSFQLMVFMRTDVYFVLQDLFGCRDLFGDGRAYARYAGKRIWSMISRSGHPPADPGIGLPRRERRAARIYSAVLVAGTTICVAAAAAFTIPADVALIVQAARRLNLGHPTVSTADGALVILILGAVHTAWAVTWWHHRRTPAPELP